MGLEGNLRLLYETIDIETIDDRLKGAINWLSQTYNPNQGFNPPNDEDRLKQMAHAFCRLYYQNSELFLLKMSAVNKYIVSLYQV